MQKQSLKTKGRKVIARRNSPALPGAPLTVSAFRNWIKESEHPGSISLGEAEARWAKKREELLRLV
jgi:hypothetical protein